MIVHLFIGAIIAYVMVTAGIVPGILFAIFLAIISPTFKTSRYVEKVPDQAKLLQSIMGLQIESESENVVGRYLDRDIHEHIIVKTPHINPANSRSTKYEFSGTIQYNKRGQIVRPPANDEVYTSWGLIYKIVPETKP